MNKIRFTANKDTNYVFHMLSVAQCGYDNEYGKRYRSLYAKEDLDCLKSREDLITVCGGEHCGELYGLLVGEPACAKVSAKEYYQELLEIGNQLLEGRQIEGIYEGYIPYTRDIIEIALVMVKYYDHYMENVWEREKERIEQYIPGVLERFEEAGFTEKAEALVGCSLKSPFFTATLVTSVAGGAEAIDISKEQDVFGIDRDYESALYFIGHEFIIYLLFGALEEEEAFRDFDTWPLTEGLAEYYLKTILGDTFRLFKKEQKYVELYERINSDLSMSAAQLYRAALAEVR